MGDFNLDLIKVDTHNQTKDFVHSLYTNAFYPTISKPTRVTDHSATLLDNIITNITGYCIKSGVLYNDISDHFPVFNLIQINSKITKKYAYISKRMNTANNIEKLNSELKNANWDNNNILIYKAQLHKSAQSAVQLLRNAYKTYKTWVRIICKKLKCLK